MPTIQYIQMIAEKTNKKRDDELSQNEKNRVGMLPTRFFYTHFFYDRFTGRFLHAIIHIVTACATKKDV